jgi:hypothetical protein
MNAWMTERDQRRFFAKVGLPDANGCMSWLAYIDKHDGYGHFKIRGHRRCAHRLMHELAIGPIPSGLEVDHRCGNRSCVAPDHLRAVTRKQNLENLGGARSDSTCGVRGVSPYRGKWRARVRHNGRTFCVGTFIRIEDAAAAAQAVRDELFTHNDRDRAA